MTVTAEQGSTGATGSQESGPTPGRPRRRARTFVIVGLCSLLAVVATFVATRGGGGSPEVAPGINQASAAVLSLGMLGHGGSFRAPEFTLTDQHGQPFSLDQFRGDSVVLSFNDDQCPDLCTLLAQSIVVAQRDLGRNRVVFLSVNVNPFFPQVSAVRQWTDDHGLNAVHSWYFGTAPVPTLERIWHEYGVYVQADATTRTVVHGSELFFIDPTGTVRAIGDFGLDAADTQYFAHAMSRMAVDLLPTRQRRPVGGPPTPPPASGQVSPGSPAPAFDLPRTDGKGRNLTLGMEAGAPTVLTFWSPSCAPCLRELSSLEAAHRALGSKVDFVGIDISGRSGAASTAARARGVSFPLAEDTGNTAGPSYHVFGTPYSFILGPTGIIKIVHPGPFTTEQIEYELRSLFPTLMPGS